MQSYEEPTRDPDVWPAPPPKDPDVWSAPTSASAASVGGGFDSSHRVRPVRGPKKSETTGGDRSSGGNRAASRNAKGPANSGKRGSNVKDLRSGAAANKERNRKVSTGPSGRSTGDKEKVNFIFIVDGRLVHYCCGKLNYMLIRHN